MTARDDPTGHEPVPQRVSCQRRQNSQDSLRVSKEPPEWIVFDCPACGRPVKMPESARGTRMACPACAELISPGEIGDEVASSFSRHLPTKRRLAPPPSVRTETRENWEPGRPNKKGLAFESTVGRIGRDVALTTPEDAAEREQRRTKIKRLAIEAAAPSWESEAPVKKPRRRRKQRRRLQIFWATFVALVLGFLTTIVIVVGRREPPSRTARSTRPEVPSFSAAAIATDSAPEFSTVSEADYAELRRAIERFIEARSVDQALPLVRDQVRVGRMMGEYWGDHPSPPSGLISVSPRSEIICYKGLFCGFAELGDYSKRVFAMEKTQDGRFLLDWESYAGWCELPWELLPTERPTRPVLLRAQIRSDDYFNHSFDDPKKYACFRLSSLDQAHRLYGYVPVENPLVTVLESKTKFNPLVLCILKVRYPDDPSTADNQVEITEWLCDGWVLRSPEERQ
jgi:hypothetical protein